MNQYVVCVKNNIDNTLSKEWQFKTYRQAERWYLAMKEIYFQSNHFVKFFKITPRGYVHER